MRVSITNQCNLRCRYCIPEEKGCTANQENVLRIEEIYQVIREFVQLGVDKIRLTGGEPLVRPGVLELVEKIGGLHGVRDFGMTTNGTLLKKYARDLKEAGLKRVNISLDSLDPKQYANITGGGSLETVLDGIEEAQRVGLGPIKINTVLMKMLGRENIQDLVYWTQNEDTEVRFIELMPIGQGIGWGRDQFVSYQEVLEAVPELQPIPAEDPSSTAVYYKLPEGRGRVGLIRPVSCKFCSTCNRIRLTAQGTIKSCLLSNEELDIKPVLHNPKNLKELLKKIILGKPQQHLLEEQQQVYKNMFQIGG